MDDSVLNLGKFEIITLLIAIGSLAFSYYQWIESKRIQKELRTPIYNTLVGLFMDIKFKRNNAVLQQMYVGNPNNPHTEISTLKWEYRQFALSMAADMQGFQETVTGLLNTLNPDDKEGKDVFRASEFGQSEDEKRLQAQIIKQILNDETEETANP